MWAVIFAGLFMMACIKWVKWKIATLSATYYLQTKGYKPPTSKEIEKCTQMVVRNIIHDLFRSEP
jgi:hypothetical protein